MSSAAAVVTISDILSYIAMGRHVDRVGPHGPIDGITKFLKLAGLSHECFYNTTHLKL